MVFGWKINLWVKWLVYNFLLKPLFPKNNKKKQEQKNTAPVRIIKNYYLVASLCPEARVPLEFDFRAGASDFCWILSCLEDFLIPSEELFLCG